MAPNSYAMPVRQALGLGLGTALKNLIPFTSLALLIYSPCIAVWVMKPAWLVPTLPTGPEVTTIYLNLAAGLLLFILNNVLAGSMSYGVVQHLRGKRASIGDCLLRGLASFPAVVGAGLLSGLRIFLFSLPLVIPGIIEACRLWVAVPATATERAGPVRAIQRSTGLTAGSRGAIFGVFLVIGLVGMLLHFLEVMLTSSKSYTTYLICFFATSLLVSVWCATSTAVGYFLLRKGKENLDLEDLARLFAYSTRARPSRSADNRQFERQ